MFEIPKVEQISKSNLARRALLTLKGKLIKLPAYGCMIKRFYELDLLCELDILKQEHLEFISTKLQLVEEMIRIRESRLNQRGLFDDESIEKEYKKLRQKIWFVDTCSDELYYNPFVKEGEKLVNFIGFSSEIKTYLKTFNQKNYNTKWLELKSNNSMLMKIIREYVNIQLSAKLDFVSPIVPIIFSDSPNYMIDVWYEMIKTTGVIAKINGEKPSAMSLIVHMNNFKKTKMINKILDKLFDEITDKELSEYKVVLLKIIDSQKLETETAETRLRYRQFIKELSNYCSNTGRVLIMVDCDSLGLVSISLGVDCFVEPLNGILGLGFGKSTDQHGRYYHPEGLKFVGYEDIREYIKRKGKPPCNCSFCSKINEKSIDRLPTRSWNYFRRGHLICARNKELQECHDTIRKNIISNAIIDKVQRSDIKNYLDLLPK